MSDDGTNPLDPDALKAAVEAARAAFESYSQTTVVERRELLSEVIEQRFPGINVFALEGTQLQVIPVDIIKTVPPVVS